MKLAQAARAYTGQMSIADAQLLVDLQLCELAPNARSTELFSCLASLQPWFDAARQHGDLSLLNDGSPQIFRGPPVHWYVDGRSTYQPTIRLARTRPVPHVKVASGGHIYPSIGPYDVLVGLRADLPDAVEETIELMRRCLTLLNQQPT